MATKLPEKLVGEARKPGAAQYPTLVPVYEAPETAAEVWMVLAAEVTHVTTQVVWQRSASCCVALLFVIIPLASV